MLTGYSYELWDGKEVLGYYFSTFRLRGRSLEVDEVSIFKQKYNCKPKRIILPIINRVISDNGIDLHVRICLDVRHKSKRQIEILKGFK